MVSDPDRRHRRSIRLPGFDYAQAGAYHITVVCQGRLCLLDPAPVRTMVQSWWERLPDRFAVVETDAFVIMPNHFHGIIVIVGPDRGQTRGLVPTDGRVGRGEPTCSPPLSGQTRGPVPTGGRVGRGEPTCSPLLSGQTRGPVPTGGRVGRGEPTCSPLLSGQAREPVPIGGRVGRGEPTCSPLLSGQAREPVPTLGQMVQWLKTMTTNAYIRGVRQEGWDPFPSRLWQRNYYERVIRNQREWDAIREYIQNNPAQWELDVENPNATHR